MAVENWKRLLTIIMKNQKREMNMKIAGILMPIASLPGRHGCGCFGKETYSFVDYAAQAGFTIWQILPLNPLGYGNSPYQPYSSYAMDDLYISLDLLAEKGLIRKHLPSAEEQRQLLMTQSGHSVSRICVKLIYTSRRT